MQKIWIVRLTIAIILIFLNVIGVILSISYFPYSFLFIIFITIIAIIVEHILEPKIEERYFKRSNNTNASMTKDRIIEILGQTSSKDWSYNDSAGIYTYNKDVNLTIRIRDEVQGNGDEFEEEWAMNFPNPEAEKIIARIFYGSSLIDEYLFVFVDGYRNILPPPIRPDDLRISPFQYNLGRILNCNHPFYKDDNLRDYDFKLKTICHIQVDDNLDD